MKWSQILIISKYYSAQHIPVEINFDLIVQILHLFGLDWFHLSEKKSKLSNSITITYSKAVIL